MDFSKRDERFMDAALSLARRGLGMTAPNPSVAALVVAETGILGRGVTSQQRDHAETQALHQAGRGARGATLYVTLEPCAMRSRGGLSCTDAILKAGVRRVVVAARDPSSFAAGKGLDKLRKNGVETLVGLKEEQARRLVMGHILRVTRYRPEVTLKMAQSADGIAGYREGRLRISSETSIRNVHMLRAQSDAVLIGVGTVLADNPLLTCRLPGLRERTPVRIIMDSTLRTSLDSHLVCDASLFPTWIFCGEQASLSAMAALRRKGVDVFPLPLSERGVSLEKTLALIAERGITRLFVEAGPRLSATFFDADCVDTFILVTSPSVYKGEVLLMTPECERWIRAPETMAQPSFLWEEDTVKVFERAG